jgi:hypothetical protein
VTSGHRDLRHRTVPDQGHQGPRLAGPGLARPLARRQAVRDHRQLGPVHRHPRAQARTSSNDTELVFLPSYSPPAQRSAARSEYKINAA